MGIQKSADSFGVLVVGGGVAGATVAERLGRAGVTVHLIEKQADIGGHVADMGCKATDVCLKCNVCVAHTILRKVKTIPAVCIHTHTELIDVHDGKNGSRFTAVLRSVAPEGKSPAKRRRHSIHLKSGFHAGISITEPNTIDVDAIVVAIGYDPYDPLENSSFGYGRVLNIITGMEAEKQLAAHHRIVRITDGQTPQRIAFIQCVGSRTEEVYRRPEDTDYCSTVCCSYALRMARLMKYQAEESQITIFYMDIQNFGKGFDTFYRECKEKMRFIRSRPYELNQGPNGSVRIKYTPEHAALEMSGVCEEEFDLVVLAVGIRPSAECRILSDKLGMAVDEQGFFGMKGLSGLPDVAREGFFVAGACESPKDIAGSIAQAEAVSALILHSR